jgi:hypothetical protein
MICYLNYGQSPQITSEDRRGRDSIVVGFITTYAISTCQH